MCESYLFTLIPLDNAVALPNSSLIPRLFWSGNETSQFVQLNNQLASKQRTYVHFHCLITKGLNYTYCCLCTLTPSKYDVTLATQTMTCSVHVFHSCLHPCLVMSLGLLLITSTHLVGGVSVTIHCLPLVFLVSEKLQTWNTNCHGGIFQPKTYHHSCGAIIVVISEQYALAMTTTLPILTSWQLHRMNNIIVHINNKDQFCCPSEDGKRAYYNLWPHVKVDILCRHYLHTGHLSQY